MSKPASLLSSQANEVFDTLDVHHFDPEDFTWTDMSGHRAKLNYRGGDYFFVFGGQASGLTPYSPGADRVRDFYIPHFWNETMEVFRRWLGYLHREVETTDLWSLAKGGGQLTEVAVATELPAGDFSSAEKEYAVSQLRRLEEYIIETQQLTADLSDFVSTRLNLLEQAVEHQSKSAWLHTLLGVLVAIASAALSSPESAQDLLRTASGLFGPLFGGGGLPALP